MSKHLINTDIQTSDDLSLYVINLYLETKYRDKIEITYHFANKGLCFVFYNKEEAGMFTLRNEVDTLKNIIKELISRVYGGTSVTNTISNTTYSMPTMHHSIIPPNVTISKSGTSMSSSSVSNLRHDPSLLWGPATTSADSSLKTKAIK